MLSLALPAALGFTLVLVRVSALMAAAPVFSSRTVPMRLKAGMAFVLALVAWTGAGSPLVPEPEGLSPLVALVLSEVALGLTAGLSSRLFVDAAQAAGQVAASAMGLGYGAMLDPHSGTDSSTVGELLSVLTLGAAVALQLPEEAVLWLVRSVQQAPPGAPVELGSLFSALTQQVVVALAVAVRVGWPLFVAALLGYAVLGLAGKAAPQLSLSNLGFSVTVLSGGTALYLAAPAGAEACARLALAVFRTGG